MSTHTTQSSWPFHASEQAIHARLGITDEVAIYDQFIRRAMPDQHREFFSDLPYVIIGAVDGEGFPWAMPVFDPQAGQRDRLQPFIDSPSPTHLVVDALPAVADVLGVSLAEQDKVGVLGIQLATRRRNRMNGVVRTRADQGFELEVDQSFGNCPKYIQLRDLRWRDDQPQPATPALNPLQNGTLSSVAAAFIQQADTFFIASRTKTFDADARSGVDASHRGGKPGFVKVEGNTITFPDYIGNKFFNTVGNIESDGRVGLFFPNFDSCDALYVTGRAKIHWQGEDVDNFAGAERLVSVDIERWVYLKDHLPMTGRLQELSPFLNGTGDWSEPKRDDWQQLVLSKKVMESDSIASFYFSPQRLGTKLPRFKPGQFLPIKVTLTDGSEHQRSYTLSTVGDGFYYRISVKREENGTVSRYLHDEFNLGDTLTVGKPAGQFTLVHNSRPIVLLSTGVGITPMLAMLEGQIQAVARGATPKPVWFIHGSQHPEQEAFGDYVTWLATQHDWLHIHSAYSQVDSRVPLSTWQSRGRVNIALIKQLLPFDAYEFYLCGGTSFMKSMYQQLRDTGVEKSQIHYEFFGEGELLEADDQAKDLATEAVTVEFTSSGKTAQWQPEGGTLLEFAEAQGLSPEFSCRNGQCGACACQIDGGEVVYTKPIGQLPPKDQVLLCSAKPANGNKVIKLKI